MQLMDYRKKNGLSRQRLAERCGISDITIWRIEKRHSLPSDDVIDAIVAGTNGGVTREDLLGGRQQRVAAPALENLTAESLRKAMHYDPETGTFTPKFGMQRPLRRSNKNRYQVICVYQRAYLGHRLAWLYVHGVWPTGVIDHINHDKGDNRIANLRDVSFSENQMNRVEQVKKKPLRIHVMGKGRLVEVNVDGQVAFIRASASIEEAAPAVRGRKA